MSNAPANLDPRSNANLALLQFENLGHFGTYTRLHFESRAYTNLEELQYAGRLARVLRQRDLAAGERVVALMPNSPELLACFQAVWTVGGAVVAPFWRSSESELTYIIRNSDASAVITVPALAGHVVASCHGADSLKHVLVLGETNGLGLEDISQQIGDGPCLDAPVARSPHDPAMLVYTAAGSRPRGVILTHGNIVAAMDALWNMNPDLPRLPMVHVLPLTHVFGLLMLLCANRWGLTSILLRQFDPVKTLSAVAAHGAGYLPVVPTMMVYLLGVPRQRFNTETMVRVSSGGAALPEGLRLTFEEAFHCRVDQGYGMTESVGTITSYSAPEAYRPGSAGRATPGVEVLILDEQNHPVPPRNVGEICVRGANITPGYWRDPVATQQAFSGRWLHTGDLGYQDEDGFLYLTGRRKELIIKGGENIAPREIEDVLYQHPAVAEAAVVGVPDPVFGEEICAVIQLKPGQQPTADEIRLYVSRQLSKFKVPGQVVFQAALPRTASGALAKRQIYEQFAGGIVAA